MDKDTPVVVVVISRHRKADGPTVNLMRALVSTCVAQYKAFWLVSTGLTTALGTELTDICEDKGVPVVDYMVWFRNNACRASNKGPVSRLYNARHAALMEIGTTFHIFSTKERRSGVEDLVERLRDSGKHYTVYGVEAEVIESSWEDATKVSVSAAKKRIGS